MLVNGSGELHTAVSDQAEDAGAEEGNGWCNKLVRVELLLPLAGEEWTRCFKQSWRCGEAGRECLAWVEVSIGKRRCSAGCKASC